MREIKNGYFLRRFEMMKSVICLVVAAFLAVTANAGIVITEVMPGSLHDTGAANGDWFELTNSGATAVNITGWSWVDNSTSHAKLVFPSMTIQAGQSILCLDESAANAATFRTIWGIDNSQVILDKTVMGDFHGLGKSGDGVFIYDASNKLVVSYSWANSTDGFSIDVYGGGASSVIGVNGAYASSDPIPDVASPFLVPEPATLIILGLGFVALRSSKK